MRILGLVRVNHAEFTEIHDRLGSFQVVPNAAEVDRRIRAHTEVVSTLYYFQVQDSAGAVIFRSTNLGASFLPSLPTGESRWSGQPQGVGAVRICGFQDGVLSVQVASPLKPVQWLLKDYERVGLHLPLGVALARIGLGWAFAGPKLQRRPPER